MNLVEALDRVFSKPEFAPFNTLRNEVHDELQNEQRKLP